MGEVREIFSERVLAALPGRRAIGHTRYSTAGLSVVTDAQPIVVKTAMGPLAVVHNGNLVNGNELRRRLEKDGSIFQTTSDTEVILHLMARSPRPTVVESLMAALEEVAGAYSLLLVTEECLIAARDPYGFRPLVMGQFQGASCFASETCAFDLLGATARGEIAPGEVVVACDGSVERYRMPKTGAPSRCAFEHVYFARPDSRIFDDSVSHVRTEMGARLARESPVDADVVVPVPDSGLFPALGYSRASGLQYEPALIRNHYVGRTFIEPRQSIRDFGVRVKLNPVKRLIAGRRIALVDDSIVRGTTSRKIVRMVREAGATEVHLRICSPPTAWPCHYGIDTPRRQELIAASKSVDEIRDFVEADSLAYLSLEGMLDSLGGDPETYCTACWTGEYRVAVGTDHPGQSELFPIHVGAHSP
jgi:amidophosphoribosyltransferase